MNVPKRSPPRHKLIIATLAAQAVVLAVGWAIVFTSARHRMARSMQETVFAQNVGVADRFAALLNEMQVPGLTYGTWEWERVQKLVEDMHLPAGAFVCLLDGEGHILCHPEMRRDPSLRGINLGGHTLVAPDGATTFAGAAPGKTVSGRASFFLDGTHYVTTRVLPALEARLLVHQPESGLVALGTSATRGILLTTAVVGSGVLGITGLVTLRLIRRHNRTLEAINRELEDEVDRRTKQTLATRNALILGLAKLADYRDSETGRHLDRICAYSAELARHLRGRFEEITDQWIERLRLAASLHDIGKVGIADSILLKPGGLTDAERVAMQRHPVIGADTLIALRRQMGDDPFINMAIQIALEHHERWDGKGYPVGLSGDQIALSARIVAVADVYDALTSSRIYKAGFTHDKAAAIIREGRGTQFDPRVVEAFEQAQDQLDLIRRKYAAGGSGAGPEAGEGERQAA